jgi:hypothetical protein
LPRRLKETENIGRRGGGQSNKSETYVRFSITYLVDPIERLSYDGPLPISFVDIDVDGGRREPDRFPA